MLAPNHLSISNLQIDSVISAGSFGVTVYKSRLKETMTNYAVKVRLLLLFDF